MKRSGECDKNEGKLEEQEWKELTIIFNMSFLSYNTCLMERCGNGGSKKKYNLQKYMRENGHVLEMINPLYFSHTLHETIHCPGCDVSGIWPCFMKRSACTWLATSPCQRIHSLCSRFLCVTWQYIQFTADSWEIYNTKLSNCRS